MADDDVARNLSSMDDLDFRAWNRADWHGRFARYHTDDVFVDVHGQPATRGIEEHIKAMEAMVESTGGHRRRSNPIRSRSDPRTGPAWSANSRTAAGW